MAPATSESCLRAALEDTVAALASAFPPLTLKIGRESGVLRFKLNRLRDELRWIFGMAIGLHRLVQRYEDDGQTLNYSGRYSVFEGWNRLFIGLRDNMDEITAAKIQSTFGLLKPCQSLIALACGDANTLLGVHQRFVAESPLHSAAEKPFPKEESCCHCPGKHKAALETSSGKEEDQDSCPQRSRFERCSAAEPCDAAITRWMQELNFPGHDRPPLDLFPELCLVEARNRQRPLYGEAAAEWYRYANSRWPVIKVEAEKLFSNARRHNFLQWALEFGRRRFPGRLECAGLEENASDIIELTNELEQGKLTPLHFSAMLGLSELCRYLLGCGASVNSTSRFGSPLFCALLGPEVLLQLKQPSSWPSMLSIIEPSSRDAVNVLVSSGADCSFRLGRLDGASHAATLTSLGFVASVKVQSHELFDNIMHHGGSLDEDFASMLMEVFASQIPSDSREVVARLFSIVLGYNMVLEYGNFPWDGNDYIGRAICEIMGRNNLSLPATIITAIPVLSDSMFDTAVRKCIVSGDEVYLQRLAMDSRFDANLRFKKLWMDAGTIVHMAVSASHWEMIPVLASSRADFCAIDERGRTPLMLVEDVEMLSLLVQQYGVSTETTDVDGRSIWHLAAATNDKDMIGWLCANDPSLKSNINSITKQGRSPLTESLLYIDAPGQELRRGPPTRPHVAYMLLQQEALDLGAGSAGLPVGHLAVRWGELDLVNLLVDRGVDLAVLDDQGRSPLHHLDASAGPKLVRRLVELCGSLPLLSRAGLTPMESLYANSFLATAGENLSNHPSRLRTVCQSMLRPLLTRDVLDLHHASGKGCWARFCKIARECAQRFVKSPGGLPEIVDQSLGNGILCLHQHGLLEAHEDETGRPAVLALASLHEDGTASWPPENYPLLARALRLCLASGLTRFFHTRDAFVLMKEALNLGKHEIILLLAREMPLQEPASCLGGLSTMEYAMTLESDLLSSFGSFFANVPRDQLNSSGPRLCLLLFEPNTTGSGSEKLVREKLRTLLDLGVCVNTRICTLAPEKDTTMLAEAMARGWSRVTSLLLDRGADPGLGRTHKAITTAVLSSDLEALSLVIRRLAPGFDWGFTVFLGDKPGYNAIDLAMEARAHDALEMLFSRTTIGAIIHARSSVNRGTPAHFAARENDARGVEMLRRHGADLGRVDDGGRSVLDILAGD